MGVVVTLLLLAELQNEAFDSPEGIYRASKNAKTVENGAVAEAVHNSKLGSVSQFSPDLTAKIQIFSEPQRQKGKTLNH